MNGKKVLKLRPLEDRLVVETIEETDTMAGGVLIIPPTISKDKPQEGRVVSVGPGKLDDDGKRLPMEIKVGDIILFTKYGPTEVKVNGKEVLILNQSDVLAVLEE